MYSIVLFLAKDRIAWISDGPSFFMWVGGGWSFFVCLFCCYKGHVRCCKYVFAAAKDKATAVNARLFLQGICLLLSICACWSKGHSYCCKCMFAVASDACCSKYLFAYCCKCVFVAAKGDACCSHLPAPECPKTKLSGLKSWPKGPDLTASIVPGSRSSSTHLGTYLPPARTVNWVK